MNKPRSWITLTSAFFWLGVLLWSLTGQGPTASLLAQTDLAPATGDEELVYLDPNGVIRVLDPDLIARPREIQWSSPEGGWHDFALGDFNGDGDYEIAAVGGAGKDAKLAIYDPVVVDTTGLDVNRTVNEIPWNILYYTSTISSTLAAGKPMTIAAGNLDPAIPGDELIFNLEAKDSLLYFWHRVITTTTMQLWQPQIPALKADSVWTSIVVGDIDSRGPMEIVLIDSNDGKMRVYRLEGKKLAQLYDYESNDRPWSAAAIGQMYTGGFGELVAVRETPKGLPSMIVFRYLDVPEEGAYFRDQVFEYFEPSPSRVFLANVNGFVKVQDGGVPKDVNDEEIFMLRTIPRPTPPAVQNSPHLFMRNPGEDKSIPRFEVLLDSDNGYQAGVGAEVDGDGRDEVVIMRNNRIRIYLDPNVNTLSIRDYTVNSNSRTLRAANLDALGYLRLPKIVVKPTQLGFTIPTGGKGQAVITVTNEGNIDAIPFNIYLRGSSTWLRAEALTGTTPTKITLNYDTLGLPPVTNFLASIDVVPDHPQVPSTQVVIPVSLQTRPGLWPVPSRVIGMMDCVSGAARSYRLSVGGLLGVRYSAGLINANTIHSASSEPLPLVLSEPYTVPWPSEVAWASVTGLGSILPTTLTIAFRQDTGFQGQAIDANLVIQADNNQGVRNTIQVPVAIACQNATTYLPVVGR